MLAAVSLRYSLMRALKLHTNLVAACNGSTLTSAETWQYNKDPAPLFFDKETQQLLKSMTQMDINKVFRKRATPDNNVEYKFMTTEELETEFEKSLQQAERHLQMPPVVNIKKDQSRVISKDPALRDFSKVKYVITDITYGLRQSERKVVVRQTDGTLEYSTLAVAKRANQIYFPIKGRNIVTSAIFEDVHLKRCLNDHKYEHILDRLTLEFEPYEEDFHRITALVYQHLNETKQFDMLRSTRHFGPMAFFYAWHRCIDDLLYDMIRRDFISNGVELIALLYKFHNITSAECDQLIQRLRSVYAKRIPNAMLEFRKSITTAPKDNICDELTTAIGKTKDDFEIDEACLQFIEIYIKEHALKKVQLELAVQTLREINAEKKELYEGLTKAHGIQ